MSWRFGRPAPGLGVGTVFQLRREDIVVTENASDHHLERRHLDMALERGAGILDFGDLFCAMQGKWDKRADVEQLRPELVSAKYLDRLVDYNADFYRRYAANWILLARGNHETSIERHHQTDLTERLHEFDAVVSCTASTLPIIGLGAVERALKKRRHRPMFMVDLAVPRDIEPEVKALEDVYLYTVDDLSASSHLSGTKWRGKVEGVHVDVYLPHESQLGSKLRLRTEVLAEHTDQLGHGKWRLLTIEAHTITKFAALLDRADTEKGAKDAREIASLLDTGVCATEACAILAEATAGPTEDLRGHVAQAFELLRIHAGMNRSQRRILLRRSREWDVAIAAVTTPVERSRPALG